MCRRGWGKCWRETPRILRAKPCGDRPGLIELDDHSFLQTQGGFVERQVHDLTTAAPARVPHRHQQTIHAVHTGPVVGQGDRDGNGWPVGEAGGKLHVRKRLGNAIVAALPGQRSGVAEWRETQAAQARLTLLRLRRQGYGSSRPGPRSSTMASAATSSRANHGACLSVCTSAHTEYCHGFPTGNRAHLHRQWPDRGAVAATRPAAQF